MCSFTIRSVRFFSLPLFVRSRTRWEGVGGNQMKQVRMKHRNKSFTNVGLSQQQFSVERRRIKIEKEKHQWMRDSKGWDWDGRNKCSIDNHKYQERQRSAEATAWWNTSMDPKEDSCVCSTVVEEIDEQRFYGDSLWNGWLKWWSREMRSVDGSTGDNEDRFVHCFLFVEYKRKSYDQASERVGIDSIGTTSMLRPRQRWSRWDRQQTSVVSTNDRRRERWRPQLVLQWRKTLTKDRLRKMLKEEKEGLCKGLNSMSNEEQIEEGDEDHWGSNREGEKEWEWRSDRDPNGSFRWDIRRKWRIDSENVRTDLPTYLSDKYNANAFICSDRFERKISVMTMWTWSGSLIVGKTWTLSKVWWIAKAKIMVPKKTRLIRWRLFTECWNFFDGGKVGLFEEFTSIEWKIVRRFETFQLD